MQAGCQDIRSRRETQVIEALAIAQSNPCGCEFKEVRND